MRGKFAITIQFPRVGLTHLKGLKVKHNSQNFIDLSRSSGNSVKSMIDFSLHCTNLNDRPLPEKSLCWLILAYRQIFLLLKRFYCKNQIFKNSLNKEFINANIIFIGPTECFNCSLSSRCPTLLNGTLFSSLSFFFTLFLLLFWFFVLSSCFKSRCSCQSCLDQVVCSEIFLLIFVPESGWIF